MSREVPAELAPVLERHGLSLAFPPAVEREVAALGAAPGLDDPALADWTDLAFVTIDNDDSKDLDQALYLERSGAGFRVCYALADAAHFVGPRSALFTEALERGASYYLPGLSVPMLPRALSEGLVSLNPDGPRRALVFDMRLDRSGQPLSTRLVRARIRSRAKLTYAGVQAFFDHPAASPLAGREFSPSLALFAEVGRLRLADAHRRDVVQFNRADVEVEWRAGRLQVIARPRAPVSRYNEQISLLCNMEGARLLAERRSAEAQPVYRVHEAPPPEALERLARISAAVARDQGLDPDRWAWRRGRESLAAYLDRLPAEPGRVRAAIERQALLVNQRSVYSAEPGLHYALGVTPYSRFSSPMREVVGVFTHKEALEALGLEEPRLAPEADEALRQRVIQAANAAKQRQSRITKDVTGLAIEALLSADLQRPFGQRPERPATVMGLSQSRLYVRLDDPPVDLKVYLADLERRLGVSFAPAADETALQAEDGRRLCLGDRLILRTAAFEAGRFHLLPLLPAAGGPSAD